MSEPKNPMLPHYSGDPGEIVVAPDKAQSYFCDNMSVFHSKHAFYTEWRCQFPDGNHVIARIALTPEHMADVIRALNENYSRFKSGIVDDVIRKNRP